MGEVEVDCGSECVVQIERECCTAISISENAIKKKKLQRTCCLNPQHPYIQKYFWIEAASAVHSLHRTLRFRKTPSKKKKKPASDEADAASS
jgi:hypothetical protein